MPAFTADDCRRFIAATTGRETPELLARAMALVPAGRALELGCGAGDDAVTLAEAGFAVTVVDEFAAAVDSARTKAEAAGVLDRLDCRVSRFEDLAIERGAYDVIHARFSLPFCRPEGFPVVWAAIRGGLRSGGVFAGQLFGPHDDFVLDPERAPMAHQTRAEVDALLADLEVLHLEEVERDGVTATGRAKHWHVYHMLWRVNEVGRDSR